MISVVNLRRRHELKETVNVFLTQLVHHLLIPNTPLGNVQADSIIALQPELEILKTTVDVLENGCNDEEIKQCCVQLIKRSFSTSMRLLILLLVSIPEDDIDRPKYERIKNCLQTLRTAWM